jgi:NAD(P)-dependent dehydrogenase (short-subunit alcohol dehydrogenase family)
MSRTLQDFTGKTVVITGASAGCGLGLAQRFARQGASVVMLARDTAKLDAALCAIRDEGGQADYAACDITDDDAVTAVIGALPRIDVLVNNAGTNIPEPFVEVAPDHLRSVMRLNMRATYVVTRRAVATMRKRADLRQSGAAIITIGSQMGHIGSPGRTAYCTTKHGLEGLTKALAVELAPENIRVNCIAPTFIDTPLIRRIVDTSEKQQALFGRIPMGRIATVEDVAAAATFLASDDAAMVTGTSLLVDGGWCAW